MPHPPIKFVFRFSVEQRTHQDDFHGTNDIHGTGQRRAGVKQHADGTAKLRPYGSGYHEVAATAWYYTVGGDRRHRNGSQHCHATTSEHDQPGREKTVSFGVWKC